MFATKGATYLLARHRLRSIENALAQPGVVGRANDPLTAERGGVLRRLRLENVDSGTTDRAVLHGGDERRFVEYSASPC
jgi:hypothetical protein